MRTYTVALTSRANGIEAEPWEGDAICVLDALQLAKQSVWPVLHSAKVVRISDKSITKSGFVVPESFFAGECWK